MLVDSVSDWETNRGGKQVESFYGPGLEMILITSTHVNVVTWPHPTAREAGECSLDVCRERRRNGFGK